MRSKNWSENAKKFLNSQYIPSEGGARSTPNGRVTLYGTCYYLLALNYLGQNIQPSIETKKFLINSQDAESGLIIGPELTGFQSKPGVKHDFEHLSLHLTCAALPIVQQFNIKLPYSINAAYHFCNPEYLTNWLNHRDLKNAWFEGNNILFIGQLLIYLRDVEKDARASSALKIWFDWLDKVVDSNTGLWGTNGSCSAMEAVYGGYHQLLIYYYENHPLSNPIGLIDTVLALQHEDGGFNPNGNGGACEDVDSVDILINCYKRIDYRRPEIRHALRRCLRHILSTQNADGGFPYNRDQPQSHMGIPGTEAGPNVSCTFPTWFRIHTLALIAEVLPREPELAGIPFQFNRALSMGWHASPPGWIPIGDKPTLEDRLLTISYGLRNAEKIILKTFWRSRSLGGRVLRRLGIKR